MITAVSTDPAASCLEDEEDEEDGGGMAREDTDTHGHGAYSSRPRDGPGRWRIGARWVGEEGEEEPAGRLTG